MTHYQLSFSFSPRSSPPKNSGRICLFVLQGIWLLPLDFQGLFIIIMIAHLLIYAYTYYLTSNSGRDKSELSWSTSQLWFVNIAIIVTITLWSQSSSHWWWSSLSWWCRWRRHGACDNEDNTEGFQCQCLDTSPFTNLTLWPWKLWHCDCDLGHHHLDFFFCLLRSFLLLFRSFFVASQKFFCCFSED